jgi:hypothetical protein
MLVPTEVDVVVVEGVQRKKKRLHYDVKKGKSIDTTTMGVIAWF